MSPRRRRGFKAFNPKESAAEAERRAAEAWAEIKKKRRTQAAENLLLAKRAVLDLGKTYSERIDKVLLGNVPLEKKAFMLSKIYSELTEEVYHCEKNLKKYGFSDRQNGLLTRLLERKLSVLREKTHPYPKIGMPPETNGLF